MRKKKVIILIISLLLIFIGYYFFFLVFPLMMVGPPCHVYSIGNYDNITHNITVEILDEKNNSVFLKQYSIQPDQRVDYDRQVRWYIPLSSEYITWSHGTYTFHFTVDNNISKSITTKIWTHQTIGVWLYLQGAYDDEPVPIDIKIATV